ncbi:MAG: cyclic pyranopterin monophosphate synthase MoaC [Candidatus Dormibacteraceae bacterium]
MTNDPSRLTHIDEAGAVQMVDISDKPETQRIAHAEGFVRMMPATVRAIRESNLAKGDPLGVARLAGIMAAKRVPELIPLAHPLPLTGVEVDLNLQDDGVQITATARVVGQTGVEMEALTAVSVAALTVIDMAKSVQKDMVIENVRLIRKSGGKSGDWGVNL